MARHKIGLGCAVMVALGASAAAAEPLRLDAAALDQVVAGIAVTGIQVVAETGPDADNFVRSSSGLTYGSSFKGANAILVVSALGGGTGTGVAAALGDNETRLRDILASEGIQLPVAGDADFVGYALADGGFNELEAVAYSPTGAAEARGKVRPLVQEPFLSATVGYGVGRTSGDGTVGMTGVVEQGQGVGTGVAIPTPLGRTLLFGIAVAVDPSALPNQVN